MLPRNAVEQYNNKFESEHMILICQPYTADIIIYLYVAGYFVLGGANIPPPTRPAAREGLKPRSFWTVCRREGGREGGKLYSLYMIVYTIMCT